MKKFKPKNIVIIIPCLEQKNSVFFGSQGLFAKSLNNKNKSTEILSLEPTKQQSSDAKFFTAATILTKKIIDSKINGDTITIIANKTGCNLLAFVSQALNPCDTELSTLSPSQKQNHLKNKKIEGLQKGLKLVKRNSLTKILDTIAEENPELVKQYKRKSSGFSSDKKNVPSLTLPKKSMCKIDWVYLLNYPTTSDDIDLFIDSSSIKYTCVNLWSKDQTLARYVGKSKLSPRKNIINVEVKVKKPCSNCLLSCFLCNNQRTVSENYFIELLGHWINFISSKLTTPISSNAIITFSTNKSKQPNIEWS